MSEKAFQNYFMKVSKHAYRMSLTYGSGFPDVLMFHGEKDYSLVELKLLQVGASGDKLIRTVFKKTQPPWYAQYLGAGGNRLFVVFQLNKGYGILHITKDIVTQLHTLKYKKMQTLTEYSEYPKLTDLIYNIGDNNG